MDVVRVETLHLFWEVYRTPLFQSVSQLWQWIWPWVWRFLWRPVSSLEWRPASLPPQVAAFLPLSVQPTPWVPYSLPWAWWFRWCARSLTCSSPTALSWAHLSPWLNPGSPSGSFLLSRKNPNLLLHHRRSCLQTNLWAIIRKVKLRICILRVSTLSHREQRNTYRDTCTPLPFYSSCTFLCGTIFHWLLVVSQPWCLTLKTFIAFLINYLKIILISMYVCTTTNLLFDLSLIN